MTDIAEIIARVLITPPAAGLTGKDPFEEASRILTALHERGFVMVPVVPTEEMTEAAMDMIEAVDAKGEGWCSPRIIYTAMLAASPG